MTTFHPVGAQEIADRIGVQKDTVWKWRERYEDFPAPVQLKMGPVWQWEDVAKWCSENHRPNRIDRKAAANGRTYEEEIEVCAKRCT